MNRIHLVVAMACCGIGVFMLTQGVRLRIQGDFGPGPGFFPFWIGVGLCVVCALWTGQILLRGRVPLPDGFMPTGGVAVALGIAVAAMIGFTILLRPVGFKLAMLLLLLILSFSMDRKHAVIKVAVAIVGSFGVHWVFESLLRVPLPYASLPFLQTLGL
jgi:putative tricarboxylic transport membrane protein